jgi:Polyphosphate kinase 2 (PPK2)
MDYRKQMIVKPGQKLRLKDVDPTFKGRYETQLPGSTNWWTSPPGPRAMTGSAASSWGLRRAELRFSNSSCISAKEEQLARFARRLDDPARNWKISESDYAERALWDDYMEAFEDALAATSTREAPWYVIPANHKWFRNLAVSRIVADTMEELGLSFPKPTVDLADIRRKYHAAAEEERRDKLPEAAAPGKSAKRRG